MILSKLSKQSITLKPKTRIGRMEKHCIGEVNEIQERYCFNKQDKFPTESMDSFVPELKTLAKTCNFCNGTA